jgi:broad specificity phosphatase PhoE
MAYDADESKVDVQDIEAVDGTFFASLSAPVEFLLIRHGESDGNAAGLFQGRQDCPLSALGRSQAAARGRAIAELIRGPRDVAEVRNQDAVVFCSPLSRAKESAEIIAREAGLAPPRVETTLIELDTGAWTGRAWTEIRTQEPETWRRFQGLSWEAIQGAESPAALFERAVRAWMILRDAATDGARTVIAVSHGGFLQWLIRSTFGCRSWFPLLPAHNCAVSRLKVEPATADRAYISWKALDEKIEVNAPI